MNFSSSLTDQQLPIVIDTSVLINLHSCTFGKEILTAIPNQFIVPELVAREFFQGTDEKTFLSDLFNAKLADLCDMTEDEEVIFSELVVNLDDGESATIAIAINRSFLPTIDERKGRSKLNTMKPDLEPAWSLDLFRHPLVVSQLGPTISENAIYLAMREGHMRIPEERAEEIIALIGEKRAKECICLPKYKKRFQTK